MLREASRLLMLQVALCVVAIFFQVNITVCHVSSHKSSLSSCIVFWMLVVC